MNVLTARENQIKNLLLEHCPNTEIAEMLGISVHTVAAHRQRIMLKLGAKSLREVYLGEQGLL